MFDLDILMNRHSNSCSVYWYSFTDIRLGKYTIISLYLLILTTLIYQAINIPMHIRIVSKELFYHSSEVPLEIYEITDDTIFKENVVAQLSSLQILFFVIVKKGWYGMI